MHLDNRVRLYDSTGHGIYSVISEPERVMNMTESYEYDRKTEWPGP